MICSLNKLLCLAEGMCLIDGCRKLCHTHENGHISVWDSSEVVTNRKLHNNNLCFATAVDFTGNNFEKIKQFLQI